MLAVEVDPAWAIGLVLALTRVAAFAIASPITGRAVPVPGRLAFAFAVSLAMARPVGGVITLGELVSASVVNVAIGAAMGYVSGIVLHLFTSAGGIIDLVSGLSVATVFDPVQGDQSGVFARMFHVAAMALFLVGGGFGLVVGALVSSTGVLPLDVTISPQPGLAGVVVELVARTVRSAVELALPIMGVLLMLELALGLASRFAPQANVFLLGLPAKVLAAMTVVGSSWMLFPDAMSNASATVAGSLDAVLRGLGAGTG